MSCSIKRILQFNEVFEFGDIHVYNKMLEDITKKCKYSWSNDLICWTDWVIYDVYKNFASSIEEKMYIRILIDDSFEKVSINNLFVKCYTIYIDQTNPFLENFCDNDNLFNPYQNLECALQLQQQLSDSIICMFGIPVFYFKVKPDPDTVDYTFKEYILNNVESVKQLKLMIPDGTMPSSNPKYTALDFDWQTDWDVEIGKTEFATAFGDNEFPSQRDFIYIPMMKRMWEVNSAYDEKNENLMWASTTWKLALVKYEDSTNLSTPEEIDSLIDGWMNNNTYEEVFGEKEINEQERLSGTTQVSSPAVAQTNLYDIAMQDAIRQKYSKDEISIINNQFNHHNNIVARNLYRFKIPTSAVTYQKGYCGSDGTLSFILQTTGTEVQDQNIIEIGPVHIKLFYNNNKYKLSCESMSCELEQFNTYLVILRWNKTNHTISLNIYKYVHQEGIAKYLLRPEMYWFDEEPIYSKTIQYNNDYEVCEKQDCFIQGYPCMMTNIKLYNKDLGIDDSIRESIKYTTNHKNCIINDLARPFNDGHGYYVK